MKNQHLDVEQDALKLLQRSAERQLSLRKLSHSLSFKIAFTTSLLGLYTWITVISPYATNGMPTGWDTGAYLAWTNSFRIAGFEYVLSPQFFQYGGLNVVPGLMLYFTTSLVSSELLGYVLFQGITLAIFFTSTLCLARKFRYSFALTTLSLAVLLTSYAFIRMTRDLYANLLCFAFLQFALALSLHLEQNPSKPAAVGLLVST